MSDEQILNASIRERQSIRVGLSRTFLIILPISTFVVWQHAYLISSMFDLAFGDYMIMFIICSLISIIMLIYNYADTINSKGEQVLFLILMQNRIFNEREWELAGLGGQQKKKKGQQQQQQQNSNQDDEKKANEQKRRTIMKEINYEATMFSLWFISFWYLSIFVFMSFVVLRFWGTSWNYYGSTLATACLTPYITSLFIPASSTI